MDNLYIEKKYISKQIKKFNEVIKNNIDPNTIYINKFKSIIRDQMFAELLDESEFKKECKKIIYKINNPKNYCDEQTIHDVQEFFLTVSPPDETGFKILSTHSRCEGYTLVYGKFYNVENLMKSNKNDYSYYNEFKIFVNSLKNKYPELQFYRLPCCWPGDTKLDLFVGFSIYPLLWTKRRYFVNGKKLLSAKDDWCINKHRKADLIEKLSIYPQYKLPDTIKEIVEEIFNEYCHSDTLTMRDKLYVEKYQCTKQWPKMLDGVYKNKIDNFINHINTIDELESCEIGTNECEWCFLPTDCTFCS